MKMDMAGSDSAVECDWDKVRRKKGSIPSPYIPNMTFRHCKGAGVGEQWGVCEGWRGTKGASPLCVNWS